MCSDLNICQRVCDSCHCHARVSTFRSPLTEHQDDVAGEVSGRSHWSGGGRESVILWVDDLLTQVVEGKIGSQLARNCDLLTSIN